MRVIDADYVLSALGIFNDRENENEHFLNGIETAVEVIENAPTVGGWISVKDRLPDKSGTYLMHAENGDVFSAEYDSCADDDRCFGYWQEYFDGGTLGRVGGEFAPVHGITHWMPLPEPPED